MAVASRTYSLVDPIELRLRTIKTVTLRPVSASVAWRILRLSDKLEGGRSDEVSTTVGCITAITGLRKRHVLQLSAEDAAGIMTAWAKLVRDLGLQVRA